VRQRPRTAPRHARAVTLGPHAGLDVVTCVEWPRVGTRRDPVASGSCRPRSTLRHVETDAELLERLRHGDEQAFVMLVQLYQTPMLRLARSMVSNEAVAEEAVQDTWMGVVRGIDRFEGRSSLKTWLFRILVNRVRSARALEGSRRLSHEPSVDPRRFDASGQWVEPIASWDVDADDRIDATAIMPVLRDALQTLPARQREVVLLRDVEGLSSEEACAVLGIRPGNQRILLHRGRASLREVLAAELKEA
jgi:RNA polymerase sigma-70 factor, ECF subfamily